MYAIILYIKIKKKGIFMFDFNFDRRTIFIIIAIMLVAWLISAGTSGILSILLSNIRLPSEFDISESKLA